MPRPDIFPKTRHIDLEQARIHVADRVTTSDLKDNSVTTVKIKDDAVTTAKILDDTIVPGNVDVSVVYALGFDGGIVGITRAMSSWSYKDMDGGTVT